LVGFGQRMQVLLGGLDGACPSRSITDLRSEPPANSQEAWACRRSCIRTSKSTADALTAGCQIRVRKVVAAEAAGFEVLGDGVDPVLPDGEVPASLSLG
jgi:hypothetical protein